MGESRLCGRTRCRGVSAHLPDPDGSRRIASGGNGQVSDLCDDVAEKTRQVESVAPGTLIHAISTLTGDGLESLRYDGSLSEQRLRNYQKMQRELEHLELKVSGKLQLVQKAKFKQMSKSQRAHPKRR